MNFITRAALIAAVVALSGCTTIKYNALEKVGIHKRDLLIENVKDTRDAQKDAQEQFKDALERFGTVISIKETKLKKAYDRLNDEYEDSVDAAEEVSEQIEEVETVAGDLFKEWRNENKIYTDDVMRRDSESKLLDTQARYSEMLKTMKESEASMKPVLDTMRNNVLYLKHNLNAQAIGSLKTTFTELEVDIGILIERMNQSIARSDDFISKLR
ncbi:MAG: DUF2959 domain-containing protein [Granulosicoccus sp.]